MLQIDRNGNILVSRGETFKVPLYIDVSGNAYKNVRLRFNGDYEVYFYLLEPHHDIEDALLIKILNANDLNENGDLVVEFASEDTDWLNKGVYYYKVLLVKKNYETIRKLVEDDSEEETTEENVEEEESATSEETTTEELTTIIEENTEETTSEDLTTAEIIEEMDEEEVEVDSEEIDNEKNYKVVTKIVRKADTVTTIVSKRKFTII